jgi:hypothetical protein
VDKTEEELALEEGLRQEVTEEPEEGVNYKELLDIVTGEEVK